jgi:pyruvate kinase
MEITAVDERTADTRRRTKIVCTIGPSSNTPDTLRAMMRAGMNVARLNFSHGDHDAHRAQYEALRSVAAETGHTLAIMADLQGPKMRTGLLEGGQPVVLVPGAPICITTRDLIGNEQCVSTSYEAFHTDVKPGDRVLLADGTMELRVDRVEGRDVHCTVVRGGWLGQNKGINLPGVNVSAPSLTEKDVEDLHFAAGLGVDFIALSFVRRPDDIRRLREHLPQDSPVRVVAKIERPEAVEHFDEILPLVDAVMVARGDLGVEMDLYDIPQIQKELIQKCSRRGIPVITATQMLESMMRSAVPTRAEVTDVANAIYDGTDAVMLSGETAAGDHPVTTVATMARIALAADLAQGWRPPCQYLPQVKQMDIGETTFGEAVGRAACHMAEALHVARIVCFTMSGYSALQIARFRPQTPVTAITISEEAWRRCSLYWGIEALRAPEVESMDAMVKQVDRLLLAHELCRPGETVIIIAGTPLAVAGRTNLIKLHTVGEPS